MASMETSSRVFQTLSESNRYVFGKNTCEKQWLESFQFSRITKKKKNEIQRRHSITVYSPVVRMSNHFIKDIMLFFNLEGMETTDIAANTNCFTK